MGLYKGNKRFEEHKIMLRRYLCISNYPEPKYGIHHKLNDIVQMHIPEECVGEDRYMDSPNIFRLLDWWEQRTFDEMFKISIIQMTESQYYVPGDILIVEGYEVDSHRTDPKFIGFKVGSQVIKPCDCLPLANYRQYDTRAKAIVVTNLN